MKRFRIVSYNIRKAVGLDRRRDPARILAVLARLDPDIVLLQEADRRLGARPTAIPPFLIAQETDFRIVHVAQTDVSLGWHGNAILARKGLEVAAPRHHHLPALEPRGAVSARIAGLTVFGTHLGLLRQWRQRQMQAIRTLLEEAPGPALVAGDFNEWSSKTGFEPWEPELDVLRPGPSYPALRPAGRLDGFALGPGLSALGTGVDSGRLARLASDHRPVWAEIETD